MFSLESEVARQKITQKAIHMKWSASHTIHRWWSKLVTIEYFINLLFECVQLITGPSSNACELIIHTMHSFFYFSVRVFFLNLVEKPTINRKIERLNRICYDSKQQLCFWRCRLTWEMKTNCVFSSILDCTSCWLRWNKMNKFANEI